MHVNKFKIILKHNKTDFTQIMTQTILNHFITSFSKSAKEKKINSYNLAILICYFLAKWNVLPQFRTMMIGSPNLVVHNMSNIPKNSKVQFQITGAKLYTGIYNI